MSATRFFVITMLLIGVIFVIGCIGTFIYIEVIGDGNLVRSALRYPGDPIGVIGLTLEGIIAFFAIVVGVVWYYDLCQADTILHFNMRLICHTFCFGLIVLGVSRYVLFPEAVETGTLPTMVIHFATHYHNIVLVQNNLNPVLLALERYVATVQVKDYERKIAGKLTAFGILVSWVISMFYYILQMYFVNKLMLVLLLLSNIIYVVIVVIMMMIYFKLYKMNISHFTSTMANSALSERYQTAENIRLLRAIMKCITFNLIGNTLIVTYYFLLVWYIATQPGKIYLCLLDNVWNVTVAFETLLMPLPFLSATGRLKKIRKFIVYAEAVKNGTMPRIVLHAAIHGHNIALVQNNFNPILLAIERCMATVMVTTYEKRVSGKVTTGMIFISWFLSMLYYNLQMWLSNARFFILMALTNVFYVVIAVVGMIIYHRLYKINLAHYAKTMAGGPLSERYQTAENIRLLRTIIKCIGVNIVANVFISFYYLMLVWILATKPDAIYMSVLDNVWNCTVALEAACLPLPFLSLTGRFEKIQTYYATHFKSHKRTAPISETTFSHTTDPTKTVMKSVTGKDVPMTANQGEYFEIFNEAWKKGRKT
uniref:Gustatory receptor n=1 Tax=Panagrellus redivivus TaxID=6233 RepID=A0A7E4ZZR5_PANRE